MSSKTDTDDKEQVALLANDIRALASQLNEHLERAAEWGLDVDVSTQRGVKKKDGRWLYTTELSVRVMAEVK